VPDREVCLKSSELRFNLPGVDRKWPLQETRRRKFYVYLLRGLDQLTLNMFPVKAVSTTILPNKQFSLSRISSHKAIDRFSSNKDTKGGHCAAVGCCQ